MTEAEHQQNPLAKITENPYKELFIYYLKGRVPMEPECFDDAFIGNWLEDGFSFLFFSKPSLHKVEKILCAQPDLTLIDKYHMSYDEWQGGCPDPVRFGRFTVTPPWKVSGKHLAATEEPIILDPGVVFGTGSHPTTQNCLEALEYAFELETIESALDLGTGTGLLALAAARLGCKHILAIDFNFLAVKTAHRNIGLNRLENSIAAVQGRAQDFIAVASDLVIANIHFDVMKHLIASKGFYAKKWFILSGLLRSQAREIAVGLSNASVKIIKKWEHEGIWHTFLGKNS